MSNRLIVFGLGRRFQSLYDNTAGYLFRENVVCYTDNNSSKWGNDIDGNSVVSPKEIINCEYDYVLVTVKDKNAIIDQLNHMGVATDKIVGADDYYDNLCKGNPICLCNEEMLDRNNDKRKVVFFVERLEFNGSVMAICYGARELQRRGYYAEIIAKYVNSKMLEELRQEGIIVNLYPSLFNSSIYDLGWVNSFDVAIVNCFALASVSAQLVTIIPTCLWIHEPSECYSEICVNKIDEYALRLVDVLTVNRIADNNFKKHYPDIVTREFRYGMQEFNKTARKRQDNRLIFALIGGFSKRKGQDFFLDAIASLNESDIIDDFECWLIGASGNDEYSKEVLKCVDALNNVQYKGLMNREELQRIYAEIDVVVVPSTEDPLPLTATEAFMMEKPCIVSDMTGSADFVTHNENGLICQSGNVASLVDCMRWCIDNRNKLDAIGKEARKIFDESFSIAVFGDNLEKLVSP